MDFLYGIVWGPPLLVLIVGVGVYLTVILRGVQFRYLIYALKIAFGFSKPKEGKGDISHFASLMTALAATIGIGNIAGVATALTVGGWGAIFWMWVTAFLGMATKYAESYLAIQYRHVDANKEMAGGPMFFIERGLGWHWLAFAFAVFGAIASFGGGNMLQANSIADALFVLGGVPSWATGVILALLVGLSIMGGIKSIGRVASFLVPFMAIFYILGAAIVLGYHFEAIPGVFLKILDGAFTGDAAVGGFAAGSLLIAIQAGVSRGLMTSEAGLGTASIAAAAAKTDVPGRQAIVSMTGSFLATICLCTITAFVIGVTGVLENAKVTGVALTYEAFQNTIFFGGFVVTVGVIFFGFTTLIGWAYYGEKCVEYFLGEKSVLWFRLIFTLIVIPGAILDLKLVWQVSDIFNGLMAYPNLIGILALSGVLVRETKKFDQMVREGN